jgi:hypothetical protein
LQQLGVPAGDLQFEAYFQLFASPLLPVAADAEQLLAAHGYLMPQSRGDAGAAFDLAGGSHEQIVAGWDASWCFHCRRLGGWLLWWCELGWRILSYRGMARDDCYQP